ncbi:MAG: LacI family transcriptional regulator [Geotoga sp.]|nr:LacI family transcriptional regulator [Geotoga sp.]
MNYKKNAKITISDIAKMANVSKATVSYVINNKPGVSETTRNKILQIIEEHNYIPNLVARGLAGKKTNFIGLVIPDISDMFYARIIKGVEHTANKFGYSLNLFTTQAQPEREKQVISIINKGFFDGLILMSYFLDKKLINLLKVSNIPLVLIDNPISDNDIYKVIIDNEEGGYNATKYLIQLGHTKICFLMGPDAAWDSNSRFKGYLKALKEHSIEFNPQLVEKGNFTREGGYRATKKLLKKNIKFTAIFSANDQMAIGAIQALKEEGYNVPGDVSIIGFDNIEASSIIDPPLTTVNQPSYNLGEKAVEVLVNLINKEPPKQKKIILKTEIIERKSCKKIN